jgi:TolB-like protein/Tfp pilus assembly protein PilF
MRENGGRIVLMDFGTGELLSGTTNRLVGTPLYLAPEIFRGQKASVQSDLYSLGVLLFYLVTGRFPVRAESMEQLARAHADRQRRSLRDMRPDAPEPFVRAIECALDSDPTRRYHSVGEMEAALREAVAETPRAKPAPAELPAASFTGFTGTRLVPARGWWKSRASIATAAVVLAAIAVGAFLWSRETPAAPAGAPTGAITSVAVLPITDQSEAPSPSLSEGLTDQLINTVGQIRSLRVTSRTSVMPFKGAAQSTRDIAHALGVDALLESSMLRVARAAGAPDRIRVNARLVMAGTDTLVWSKSFERELGDVLALQAEIAQAVAEGVKAVVTPREVARLQNARHANAAAEEAYLAGRYHLGQYGLDSAALALEAFTRAEKLDPLYAAALAGAAQARFALGFGGRISHAEARALALSDVREALRLDPDLPDAHAAFADVKFYYDWDWRGAESEYRRAIDLNPSFTYARSQYARYLAAANRMDDAQVQASLTADLDPLSAEAAQTRGLILYYARKPEAAAIELQRALALDPSNARAHRVLARVRESEGRFDDGLAEMQQAIELAKGAAASWQLQVARLHALAGNKDEARAVMRRVTDGERTGASRVDDEQLAYVRLALDDQNGALDLLERAMRDRQPSLLWLAVDPRVEPLRPNPRFRALVKSLGLDQ